MALCATASALTALRRRVSNMGGQYGFSGAACQPIGACGAPQWLCDGVTLGVPWDLLVCLGRSAWHTALTAPARARCRSTDGACALADRRHCSAIVLVRARSRPLLASAVDW